MALPLWCVDHQSADFRGRNRKELDWNRRGNRGQIRGSQRHQTQELRIIVRIQTAEFRTVPAVLDGSNVEMKNRTRVMLRRFVLVRVQERRFDEGDKHRQHQYGRLICAHHLSLIPQTPVNEHSAPLIAGTSPPASFC